MLDDVSVRLGNFPSVLRTSRLTVCIYQISRKRARRAAICSSNSRLLADVIQAGAELETVAGLVILERSFRSFCEARFNLEVHCRRRCLAWERLKPRCLATYYLTVKVGAGKLGINIREIGFIK